MRLRFPTFVSERMSVFGQIIILNGVPRSGKSSIADAIRKSFGGEWIIFGVDAFMANNTPLHLQPGLGLRPGGERPDLEPSVSMLYTKLHQMVADMSRKGENVIVDVGYHDSYSTPLHVREAGAKVLEGLPVLFVGVRCPIEEIMLRRNQGPDGVYVKGSKSEPIPEAVQRWQDEVHKLGIYDLEVDTSQLSPEECAIVIRTRMESGNPNDAFWQN